MSRFFTILIVQSQVKIKQNKKQLISTQVYELVLHKISVLPNLIKLELLLLGKLFTYAINLSYFLSLEAQNKGMVYT